MSGIGSRIREGLHEATRPANAPAHTANTTTTHSTTAGVPEGTAGPHGSRVANAADPRVDSDLDNRAQHHGHHGHHGHHAGAGATTGVNTGSTNAGPHNSNIANKLDPRVDSDLDGGRHAGMNQTTGRTGNPHTTTTAGTHGSTNAGPHDSNIANKLDPRVDSDLDGSRNMGMNQTTGPTGRTANTGTFGGSTNAGPHDSNFANKMDPRVDSDLDGGRHAGMNQTTHHHTGAPNVAHGTTTQGTTTTKGSTNAGPHKSNLLNKLDPRVDSDLDGSKNAGMNQTTRTNY